MPCCETIPSFPLCSTLLPAGESAPPRVEVRGLGVGSQGQRGWSDLLGPRGPRSEPDAEKMCHDATTSSSLASDLGAGSRTSFSVLTQTHVSLTL